MHLLDLPVEILLKIFKKLNNMDVLYSSIGVEGLDILAQDEIFTNTLNFELNNNDSFDERKLNRFCNSILPRIQNNIKYLILDTRNMDHILRVGVYQNLIQMKIFDFHATSLLNFCTNELLFRSNFKNQITELTLFNSSMRKARSIDETTNIFIKLLNFFENLSSFNSIGLHFNKNSIISFINLPSTTFVWLNLTKLSVIVDNFGDCLYLLNGYFTQLSTFIVIVTNVKDYSMIQFNSNDLNNMKCFSLTFEYSTNEYDNRVIPLLHRMCDLQDLTLYIPINNRTKLVDGIQIENDILIYLLKLHKFMFYISTKVDGNESMIRLTNDDIERTFSNYRFGQVGSIINFMNECHVIYHTFSLPYIFNRIGLIGNQFTNTIFKNVIGVSVYDGIPSKHEFFLQLTRCFPLLQVLSISNEEPQSTNSAESESESDNMISFEIIEYIHLKGLIFGNTHIDYIEQMLNQSKTRLPCLTELSINLHQLKRVTNNFTRDRTRRNCINIEELNIFEVGINGHEKFLKAQSKKFHDYFPSLKR